MGYIMVYIGYISCYTWDIIGSSFAMFPRGSRCNNSEVFQTADGRLQGR